MTLVELFSTGDCHLCDDARAVIERAGQQIPFKLREFTLMPGDPHYEEHKEMFPVVHINHVPVFTYRVSEHLLKIRLRQVAEDARPPGVDTDEPAIENT
jgi:hypothetical protein